MQRPASSRPAWQAHARSLQGCLQESLDSPIDRRSDYYRQRAREERSPGAPGAPAAPALQPLLTPPNALTLLRIVLVPVVVGLWFSTHRLAPLAAAGTFVGAAVTDWADGFLARKAGPVDLHLPDCLLACTQLRALVNGALSARGEQQARG
jgi:hypothetical protein